MSETHADIRMTHKLGRERWFTTKRNKRSNDSVLYCLAHAGGNAEDYLRWQSDVSDDLLMKAVILPGTGHRYSEDYPKDITILTRDIAAAIEQECDQCFYILGHSMGALLAWEVAKKLRKAPDGLLLSACLSPTEMPSARIIRMAEMENNDFLQEMTYFNGIDENVMFNPFIKDMVAEKLKRDFKIIAGYRYQKVAPTKVPVMVIVGEDDAHVPVSSMLKWQSHTQHFLGAKQVPGNHFYFNDNPKLIINAIDEMMRASREKKDNKPILV